MSRHKLGPPKPNVPEWLQASAAQLPGDTSAAPPGSPGAPAPLPVDFPRHLYAPQGCQTIDLRIVRVLDPGTAFDLITFKPAQVGINSSVFITHYAIFNNGLVEEDYSYLPTLNRQRIYPFHGNPKNDRQPGTFLISLGLAPDLSNYSLIPGFLAMNPQDTLNWRATNDSAVPTAMGVRVVGYVDNSGFRTTQTYGG